MFEMIGLLMAAAALLIFSGGLSGVYILITLLLVRGRASSKSLALLAGLIPMASVVYIMVCSVAFSIVVPGQSGALFGDISEPLPNGYTLAALGKMPEFARIDPKSDSDRQPQLLGYIRRIQVEGYIVYGEYGSRFTESTWPDAGDHGWFAFDTRSRVVRNFDTLAELNTFAGHQVGLVKAIEFHSHDRYHRHFLQVKRFVLFAPTTIASLLFFLFLFRLRMSRGLPARS